jgi:hypothetical protein
VLFRSGGEIEVRHLAGQLRGNGYALHRFQRAHGGQGGLPGIRQGRYRGYRFRRRDKALARAHHLEDLQPFDAGKDDDHQQQAKDGEDDAFFHGRFLLRKGENGFLKNKLNTYLTCPSCCVKGFLFSR